MDMALFMQNVKKYCQLQGVKPKTACRESGAGEGLMNNVASGSAPSVEKVQLLATYLGVTTSDLLGEKQNGPDAIPTGDERLMKMERLFLSLPQKRREEVLHFMEYLSAQPDT